MTTNHTSDPKPGGITRRQWFLGLGLAAAGGALAAAGAPRLAGTLGRQSKPPWYDLGIVGEPIMDNQLLWYLSQVYEGMADIGECLDTAARIDASDEWSWPREWLKTAERVRGVAEACLAQGHRWSAGEAFLRSASYYRAALIHHPEPADPGVPRAAGQSVACFDTALALLGIPAQAVRIPYEGTTLLGYFYRSPAAGEKAPVLIVHEGRDAWPEETKYLADAAIQRGYHCLQFHGPGQGVTIREQGLPFRPDWEKVVTPVVDFAIGQPGVDPERLALMGISMGGALAPRAAAFEKRIKICIANPGVLNWGGAMFDNFSDYPGLVPLLDRSPEAFNAAVQLLFKAWPTAKWWFRDAAWKHGVTTPAELMYKLREFNNEGIVDRITCQMLIMDGTAEEFSAGQARKLYDALGCPKDYLLFTAEDTGLVHCQTGALAVATQRMFDWLDDHL